ncbi:response regulator [Pedobacter nutrimenti]|jgi:CheY-like chemotaxis protein|uniref:Response regulator receiver domain-containing protein n=1 Tax=Pedobacter nutrimenti TaxID=1241337 RepID=A0A318U7X4_9SPHI|nr:response regulator [Pedobacter nutrimenti]PYF70138.1 response regulator receiver domain-containing protein [Pedobacter nutrimenti]
MKKIFLVDDDEIFVFLTQRMIQKTNINVEVRIFNNGQDAFDCLGSITDQADQLPDVILLDLNMPVMDGWEFLEEYAAIHQSLAKKIRLYIVSSSISPYEIERSKGMDFVTDFIIKPLSKENFTEIIDNL